MELTELQSLFAIDNSTAVNQSAQTGRNAPYVNTDSAPGTATIAAEDDESIYIPSTAVNDSSEGQAANLEQYDHNRYVAMNAYIYGNERLEPEAAEEEQQGPTAAAAADQDGLPAEEPAVDARAGVLPAAEQSLQGSADSLTAAEPQSSAVQPESAAAAGSAEESAERGTGSDPEPQSNIYGRQTLYSEGANVMDQSVNAYGDNVRTTVGSSVADDQDQRTTTDSAVATAADAETAAAAASGETAADSAESEEEGGAQHNDTGADGEELTDAEQQRVDELAAREDEVIAHEQAHISAGGGLTGSANYGYTTGPDGQRYISDGEVSIDISEEDEPEDTIAKMTTVRSAALAPAEPSAQDRQVASEAARIQAEARREMAAGEDDEENYGTGQSSASSVVGNVASSAASQFESLSGPASEAAQTLG